MIRSLLFSTSTSAIQIVLFVGNLFAVPVLGIFIVGIVVRSVRGRFSKGSGFVKDATPLGGFAAHSLIVNDRLVPVLRTRMHPNEMEINMG